MKHCPFPFGRSGEGAYIGLASNHRMSWVKHEILHQQMIKTKQTVMMVSKLSRARWRGGMNIQNMGLFWKWPAVRLSLHPSSSLMQKQGWEGWRWTEEGDAYTAFKLNHQKMKKDMQLWCSELLGNRSSFLCLFPLDDPSRLQALQDKALRCDCYHNANG